MAELRELMPRVRQVLADLQALSEAGASRAFDDPAGHRGAGETSKPPPGFDLEAGEIHKGERALYDVHLEKLELWLIHAELDRDRRKYKSPNPKARGTESDEQFAERIEREYVGEHDEAVAAKEACSRSHVRRARQSRGLDLYGYIGKRQQKGAP